MVKALVFVLVVFFLGCATTPTVPCQTEKCRQEEARKPDMVETIVGILGAVFDVLHPPLGR